VFLVSTFCKEILTFVEVIEFKLVISDDVFDEFTFALAFANWLSGGFDYAVVLTNTLCAVIDIEFFSDFINFSFILTLARFRLALLFAVDADALGTTVGFNPRLAREEFFTVITLTRTIATLFHRAFTVFDDFLNCISRASVWTVAFEYRAVILLIDSRADQRAAITAFRLWPWFTNGGFTAAFVE